LLGLTWSTQRREKCCGPFQILSYWETRVFSLHKGWKVLGRRYNGACSQTERENLGGIILEGKKGIENIDAILEIEHLDLVYIGSYDFSQTLGIPGQVGHPGIRKNMERCIRKIRNAGITAGGYVAKSEKDMAWMGISRWIDL